MKTVLKVALGILLAFVVLIVGCAALIGAGVDEAQDESDKNSITLKQYQSVKIGQATKAQLVRDFGEPQTSDSSSVEVEGLDDPVGSECVYYNRKGKLASIFQFCFDINTKKLQSKSSI